MLRTLKQLLLLDEHVCPWWLAYTFDNPLRRFVHDPRKILGGLVQRGQTVVDLGCGMGHFSLGIAELVGDTGLVLAVDVQEKMLRRVQFRAGKAGLESRIRIHRARPDRIGLTVPVDFALAFWMAHEVKDRKLLFTELQTLLKPGACLLLAEPKIHVRERDFLNTVALAESVGLKVTSRPRIRWSRAAVLARQQVA